MKVLLDYCYQVRPYADSKGHCLIELNEEETIQDVINKYIKPTRAWYEQSYSSARTVKEYVHETCQGEVTYTGRLVLLDTHRAYLD